VIAWLAVESGIAPSVLLNETEEMISLMITVATSKAKQQHSRR
tara:strand:+ start:256 stop:384 length:129 start_codon:yes stop_codon:yes gene_type:complete